MQYNRDLLLHRVVVEGVAVQLEPTAVVRPILPDPVTLVDQFVHLCGKAKPAVSVPVQTNIGAATCMPSSSLSNGLAMDPLVKSA